MQRSVMNIKENDMNMICSKCSNTLNEGDVFCPKCGKRQKRLKLICIKYLLFLIFYMGDLLFY
ncbi:zinc-ribbon domain-containing protein [Treponema medium]|uniref:zinc-ribbon domain-containing protein n=1 Tax=Treponema medium TaxID=58231 RepID=UPI001AFB659F|nr:zinc-ribbon domain-containing protein [Treponema medium]